MTTPTPTREQACEHEHIKTWVFEDTKEPAMWSCARCGVKFAPEMATLTAGRDQGLREAGTACETQSLNKIHADLKGIARKHWRAFHETSHAKWQGMAMAYEQAALKCKRAAAAIEQLRS